MGSVTRRRFVRDLALGGLSLGLLPLLAACGQPEPRTGIASQASPSMPPSPTPGGETPVGATATPTQLRRLDVTVVPPTFEGPGPTYGPVPTVYRPGPYPTQNPNDPYHLIIGASRYPSTTRSAGIATLVLLGTIRQVLPARWSTPNGARPANPFNTPNRIYTPVLIAVETYYKGAMADTEQWFFADGGRIGQDYSMREDNLFVFQVGERVVLFLYPSLPGPAVSSDTPRYEVNERYTVTADGQAVNSSYRTVPLPQLLNEIAAVVNGPSPGATPSVLPVPTAAP